MKVKQTTAQEDPTITAAREREQQRADAAYISNTQGLLDNQTRRRNRRFGRRVSLTGADPAGGGMSGTSGSAISLGSTGGGSVSYGGGGGGTGGYGDFSNASLF